MVLAPSALGRIALLFTSLCVVGACATVSEPLESIPLIGTATLQGATAAAPVIEIARDRGAAGYGIDVLVEVDGNSVGTLLAGQRLRVHAPVGARLIVVRTKFADPSTRGTATLTDASGAPSPLPTAEPPRPPASLVVLSTAGRPTIVRVGFTDTAYIVLREDTR